MKPRIEELRANGIARRLNETAKKLNVEFRVKYNLFDDEALVRIKMCDNAGAFANYAGDEILDNELARTVRFTYPKHRL
ncbi:TPA: hypothetical protein ACGXM3_005315 [Bacillus cereus]